jgi:hypothetical protein
MLVAAWAAVVIEAVRIRTMGIVGKQRRRQVMRLLNPLFVTGTLRARGAGRLPEKRTDCHCGVCPEYALAQSNDADAAGCSPILRGIN